MSEKDISILKKYELNAYQERHIYIVYIIYIPILYISVSIQMYYINMLYMLGKSPLSIENMEKHERSVSRM